MHTSRSVARPLLFLVFVVMLRAEETHTARFRSGNADPSARAPGELRSHHNGILRKRHNVLQAHSCTSDWECGSGLFCHAPKHTPSQCSACRKRGRRCYRNSMCCPGNHCHNYVCSKHYQRVSGVKNHSTSSARQQKPSKRSRKSHKAVAGAQCVRSSDCAVAHCCARHLWTRVCRAEPQEGQVCSAPLQNKDGHRVELFQRCPCSSNLICKPQSHTHTHQPGHTHSVGLHTCQEL